MKTLVVYDDSFDVPEDVSHHLSIVRFSDLRVQRRTLKDRVAGAVGRLPKGVQLLVLESEAPNQDYVLRRALHERARVIYVPSYLAMLNDEETVSLFLEKLTLAECSVRVLPPSFEGEVFSGLPVAVVIDDDAAMFVEAMLQGEHQAAMADLLSSMEPVPDDIGMADLRDPAQFLSVATSSFDVRHFNSVAATDRFTVLKRSSDTAKLRREYDFYALLPPEMQRYFVQPYGFAEEAQTASYRMERLFVPDVALQWTHRAFTPHQFAQLLRRIFHFVNCRTARTGALNDPGNEALFLAKVEDRIAALEKSDIYPELEVQCQLAFGGVRAILDRYNRLYDTLTKDVKFPSPVLSHGDLCFSNILYGRAEGTMKFIDARGGSKLEDLFMPAYYDVAKLSHSIEGSYDFINAGLFRVELDDVNRPKLIINSHDESSFAQMFRRQCLQAGFMPRLVRLFEASLFISMTPLHIDAPVKVLAFLLNADRILDQVEDKSNWN
ncbi:capsular biosynthesis protein [Achromobacter sp. NPDC008082]|uniref:capsular biosynthesis protein n=1 Tax=Achromobacter sp. NPDC008082 TaxID=3363888 RepID=UPI0036E7AB65